MSSTDNLASEPARPISWYRVPIPRETLRQLTERSDWKGFLQTVGYLALLGASAAAVFIVHARLPLPWLFLALFVHGTFWAFLLNGFHELVHGTVFRTKWLNAFFLRIYSFLSWNSHILFRASHMRHHASTLHPPDDEEVILPLHLPLGTFLSCALVNPLGMWKVVRQHVMHSFGRLRTPWEHLLFPDRDQGAKRLLARWSRIVLVGHLAIIAVSFATGHWLIAVVVSFARFYAGGFQWVINITQHIGLQDNVPDFRLCCRTIKLNPFVTFLYFRMNWHTEHHMYAAVPCYSLSKLRKVIDREMPPFKRSLLDAWKEIFSIFRLQAANPAYQHVNPLPQRT
ncbi:MAG TPA: fatty acid desaturase [Spirochaetia bacterium]|nr:fatty acid desaturase [Spirochaetia bacterium]